MEGDRKILCGPKGRHQVERPAWRGGSADSQVVLGGRQVEVPRLRVRSADGEVPLVSFEWAAATDPLDEHTMAAVAAGVSTRRYASTLDSVPADVTERGTSSSAVSRRFVALSTQRLGAFLERPLGELDLRVVCTDGVERYTRNVKRWRGGRMVQRWVASALVEAEKHFRRVAATEICRISSMLWMPLAPPDRVIADVA